MKGIYRSISSYLKRKCIQQHEGTENQLLNFWREFSFSNYHFMQLQMSTQTLPNCRTKDLFPNMSTNEIFK